MLVNVNNPPLWSPWLVPRLACRRPRNALQLVLGSTGLGAVNQSLDLSVGSRSSSGDDDVVELVEHGASNTTIAMLSVTDDDRGDNGQVTCRMTSDGQGHFKVARLHDTVYRIISTRPLDSRPVSTPPPIGSAEYCSERVCLSVCLCVCLSTIMSSEGHVQSSLNLDACFLCPWLGPLLVA